MSENRHGSCRALRINTETASTTIQSQVRNYYLGFLPLGLMSRPCIERKIDVSVGGILDEWAKNRSMS